MRPRERRDTGEQDLFRARLDQIIDMDHAMAKLARVIDWGFLEEKFGSAYTDRPGGPPVPTRLMAGLAILKHTFNLSDDVVCARWIENPYYQYFCGEVFFQHVLPLDRSSITRWRNRMGEERLQALLQESLAVATRTGAMKPADLNRVIVDTTVQPKNITFPTDAKLANRAREKLVATADRLGVKLRQSYRRVGKLMLSYPESWRAEWLRLRNLSEWARYLEECEADVIERAFLAAMRDANPSRLEPLARQMAMQGIGKEV